MFDQSSAVQTLQSSMFHTRSLNSTIAASMAGGPELWGQKSFKFDIQNLNSCPSGVHSVKLTVIMHSNHQTTGSFFLLVLPLKSSMCQLVSKF